MSKVKILLVGSVGNNLPVLRKKLRALHNSKAGPFDACFCVGPVTNPGEGAKSDANADSTPTATANANTNANTNDAIEAFPMPVYFQERMGSGSVVADNNNNNNNNDNDSGIVSIGGSKSNLYYLRGNNSNSNDTALKICRIQLKNGSGSHPPLLVASCSRHFRAPTTPTQQQQQQTPQCDLLLSSDWPQGMEDVLNVDTEPLSYDVSEAALACKPRYHLCPSSETFHASPPYRLPGSEHPGRFLALASVAPGKTPKTHKFVHALGLVPLAAHPETASVPSTLPCPFSGSAGMGVAGGVLPPPPPRLPAFSRQGAGDAYSRFGAAGTKKRGRDEGSSSNNNNNAFSLEPPDDPSLSTLFLYGLHKDVTGELQSTRSPKVLLAFNRYGATKVRHPPNAGTSTYCFVEFPSQAEALQCLLDCHGRVTIDSVDLTLKWATKSNNNNNSNSDGKKQRRDQKQQQQQQQHFVTQEEAKDSTTLFFHPPRNTKLVGSEESKSKSSVDAVLEATPPAASGTEPPAAIASGESNDEPTTDSTATATATATATTANENENENENENANNGASVENRKEESGAAETNQGGQSADTGDAGAKAKGSDEEGETTASATGTGGSDDNDNVDVDVNVDGNANANAKNDPGAKPSGFAAVLQKHTQRVLEDALNEGVENEAERVTAETEPALRVAVRCKEQYGFLEFASHAAATMALAAMTKSTDGGLLAADGDIPKDLTGTTLRWARGSTSQKSKPAAGREQRLEALGLKRRFYPADGRTDCWFCLSSPTCETHLITGVYDEWYATMPKGPVHPGHVLLVPVTHTSRGAWTLGGEWVGLVEKIAEHASRTYDSDLFVFERAMETRGGYHTHIQCVPIPRDTSTLLQTTMVAHATASGFDLRSIQSDLGVKAILEPKDSYFYAEVRTRTHSHRFLYKRESGASGVAVPLQFAREVLASVLKNPKLAHWKSCVVDQEMETKLASEFRASFQAMG